MIGALEYQIVGILSCRIFRKTDRCRIPQPRVFFFISQGFLEGGTKLLRNHGTVFKILSLQDDNKLVTADAEDRRMLIGFADQMTAALDVKIACLVSEIIVDIFQIVHINHDDGKILQAVFDLIDQLIDLFRICSLAADAGQ